MLGCRGRVPCAGPNESNLEGLPLFPEQYLPGRDGERELRHGEAWRAGESASRLEVDFPKGIGAQFVLPSAFLVWVFAVYP